MKILICGASARCISIVAKDFILSNPENEIVAFLDNDPNKANMYIRSGYYYIYNRRVFFPLDHIPVDFINNAKSYDYDYIFIVSAFHHDIYKQLIHLGINASQIIIYKREIENGKTRIPFLGTEEVSFSTLLQKSNMSVHDFAKELNTLYSICNKLIKNKYRLELLSLICSAAQATANQSSFTWHNIKLSYVLWEKNPSLFIYEAADILFDGLDEEMFDTEYIEGPYELGNVKINADDIVFDIGANFGLFSSVAASKAPLGKVYAFEPIPETQKILQKTASFYNNVEVIPLAITNHSGNVNISIEQYENNQGSASIMNVQPTAATQQVSCMSLDEFVSKNNITKVDFIKADIEGAERLLLSGSKRILAEMQPKLVICTYHYPEDPKLLEYLILSANPKYVIDKIYGKLYAFVPEK